MKIFIPIKNHSQRVPGKNFRMFGGKPLYLYCLNKFTDYEVYIDTDSDRVLNDTKLPKTLVYPRLKEHCGDAVSVCTLLCRFVDEYCVPEDIVCQIHVTSPFLKSDTLERALSHILKDDYDSVTGCNIIQTRYWRKESYGFCPVNHNPMKLEQTQDLPKFYEENSSFYMFKASVVCETGNRIGKNPLFMPVEWPESLDIDTEVEMRAALSLRKAVEDLK